MNFNNLAKLFSSQGIVKIGSNDWSLIKDVVDEFNLLLSPSMTLLELYEKSYELLLKNYRNEYVVKNEIANKVLLGRHSLKTATMLSEVWVGNNKADCVIVNGDSTCYEIKTELDSLSRLKDQINTYTKVFDKTYIVATAKHLEYLYEFHKLSPNFGIIELTKRNTLSVKVSAPNTYNYEPELMFNVLRKNEYVSIARNVQGDMPDIPNTQTYQFCKEVFNNLSIENANRLFKSSLKSFRKNDASFITSLPRSMRNVEVSYSISRKFKNQIINSLSDTLRDNQGDFECTIHTSEASGMNYRP